MRRSPWVATALLLLAVPSAAQIQNKSLKLNQPLANQYLVVDTEADLETSSYTIEAWIYPTTISGFPTVVGNDFQNGYWFGIDQTTGQLRFWPLGSDQGGVMLGTAVIPLNQWSHVAASYDEATHTARLYIDGLQDAVSSAYAGAPDASVAPHCIGADRPNNGPANFFFRGWIDEVKIWSRALGAPEIAVRRFHRAGTPKLLFHGIYDNLEAYWDMEDPIAGTYQDRWAGDGEAANTATPVNGSTQSATTIPPIAYNHGMFFSGFGDFVYRNLPLDYSFEDGLTIEAWIAPSGPFLAPNAPEGIPLPVRTIVGRSSGQGFWFGLNESNRLRFYPSGGVGQYFESNQYLPLEKWTHVAAVYRPGMAELYVNGVLDTHTDDFTDPVVENLVEPLIGADPLPIIAAGPDVPVAPLGIPEQQLYLGWMDEVRVTGAALGAAKIREGMFRAAPAVGIVDDELGHPHTRLTASLDPRGPELVYASAGARFDRSGAPVFGPEADVAFMNLEGYRNQISVNGAIGNLPGGADYTFLDLDLTVSQSFTVNDVNVFVSVSATSFIENYAADALQGTQIRLQAPSLFTINLMDYGDGRGRDIHTVFDDEAVLPLGVATTPYIDGVKPADPLTGFDGANALGLWRLSVNGGKGVDVGVWAWGLSFNENSLLDADGDHARAFDLRLAGANPVREGGSLAFTLPVADDVTLAAFDVAGREVRRLVKGHFAAGEHRVAWNARGLAPGLYMLRLTRGNGESKQVRATVVR